MADIVQGGKASDKRPNTSSIYRNIEGVALLGSTLGRMGAVWGCFKKTGARIPVNSINVVRSIRKEDVEEASLMLQKNKDYAVIFAFDLPVTPEADEYARQVGVKIYVSHSEKECLDQVKGNIVDVVLPRVSQRVIALENHNIKGLSLLAKTMEIEQGQCTIAKRHGRIGCRDIEGVTLLSRTLGSLKAIVHSIVSTGEPQRIPVNDMYVTFRVRKEDVEEASLMLEKNKDYAVIFAFDIPVTPEASEYADQVGVKIYASQSIAECRDHTKAFLQSITTT